MERRSLNRIHLDLSEFALTSYIFFWVVLAGVAGAYIWAHVSTTCFITHSAAHLTNVAFPGYFIRQLAEAERALRHPRLQGSWFPNTQSWSRCGYGLEPKSPPGSWSIWFPKA